MIKKAFLLTCAALIGIQLSEACTNILVTKGASKDGSTMVTYSADSHTLYGELYYRPAAKYPAGTLLKIYEWDTGKYLGEIAQAAATYSVVGNMNEHQLLIGESTFGGRSELEDPTAIMDYGSLIYVTLQRAKTAREAIKIMGELVAEYGYYSSGESISIADPNEVWVLEIMPKKANIVDGKNVDKGAVWVAMRIPDGCISAHANHARITTFPLNDPENCVYAPDVISYAKKMGFYNGSDKDFSFSDTYAPLDFSAMRGCESRVWSVFRQVADGMEKYEDYAMGYNPENRMPLYVKAKEKVSVKQVADFMRNHFEGTKMDMTADIGAGGSKSPYRWRPMNFTVDGVEYVNERAIATQQTGWWYVGQCRGWLPDPIGGVLWFGVDDAATSPLTPIYCGSTRVPASLEVGNGNMLKYSETAMFWIVNRIAQFAYLRYDHIGKEVRQCVDKFENRCMAEIPAVDVAAKMLYENSPEAAINFITDYSVNTAQGLFAQWCDLDKYLMVKYIDGNIKKQDEAGKFINNGNGAHYPVSPSQPGYSEKWKRAVKDDAGEVLKVPTK